MSLGESPLCLVPTAIRRQVPDEQTRDAEGGPARLRAVFCLCRLDAEGCCGTAAVQHTTHGIYHGIGGMCLCSWQENGESKRPFPAWTCYPQMIRSTGWI